MSETLSDTRWLAIPHVILRGDLHGFSAMWSSRELEAGLHESTLVLSAATAAEPPPLELFFTHPNHDIQARWTPAAGMDKSFGLPWGPTYTSRLTNHAPVVCLYSNSGENRLTISASDALNAVGFRTDMKEETALFECVVKLFEEPHPKISRYEIRVRIDRRPLPYYEVLRQVAESWAEQPGFAPAQVPACAREPMYSTWYSFHQNLESEIILEQCRLSRPLGCDAVIVDDGWQTKDSNRGYAHCGDWEALRLRDMATLVKQVHGLGMKFLLWYSVPHIGRYSRALQRFEGKLLGFNEKRGFGVIDPRFPEAREYLIDLYVTALREWDLDGFKLDFIDSFYADREALAKTGDGRDYDSVNEAVDRLLTDAITRLRAIKPDILIEFRQCYIGPLVRKFGNMFRAGDCPADSLLNRVRILDIRLLCGNTAAHADMFMWNPGEPVESAALQLICTLFSVPQLSMRLDQLPPDHLEMVRFWLGFWREHRDALLDGYLEPLHPELNYPVVRASTSTKRVVAAYADMVVPAGADIPATLLVVNGSHRGQVVLEIASESVLYRAEVFDCRGHRVNAFELRFRAGIHALEIPAGGVLCATQIQ